jgi:acyl-CoA synthetase (AMP-forming)/AMP-acid ligase II
MQASTLREIFKDEHSDRPCVVIPHSGVTLTYRQLSNEIVSIAQTLSAAGIQSGVTVSL